MSKKFTFQCSGLTPLALVAAIVSAAAGLGWDFMLAALIVAVDFRITTKKDPS